MLNEGSRPPFANKIIEASTPLHKHEKLSKFVAGIINRAEQKFVAPMNIEFPEAYKTIIVETMRDPKIIPFIYSNHYDLANGLPLAVMVKTVTDLANTVRDPKNPFEGCLMPVSTTLFDGKQGSFMQETINQVSDFFSTKYHTYLIGCTTKNDRTKRDVNLNNVPFMRRFVRITHDHNSGIALFPEATVEGGRRIKEGEHKGQRKGLQEFDSHDINENIRIVERFGGELLYIPIALDGPNILHTDHRILTWTGAQTLASKNPKTIINVRVGRPITQTDMINEIAKLNKGKDVAEDDISKHLRGLVACMLPPDFLPPTDYK